MSSQGKRGRKPSSGRGGGGGRGSEQKKPSSRKGPGGTGTSDRKAPSEGGFVALAIHFPTGLPVSRRLTLCICWSGTQAGSGTPSYMRPTSASKHQQVDAKAPPLGSEGGYTSCHCEADAEIVFLTSGSQVVQPQSRRTSRTHQPSSRSRTRSLVRLTRTDRTAPHRSRRGRWAAVPIVHLSLFPT